MCIFLLCSCSTTQDHSTTIYFPSIFQLFPPPPPPPPDAISAGFSADFTYAIVVLLSRISCTLRRTNLLSGCSVLHHSMTHLESVKSVCFRSFIFNWCDTNCDALHPISTLMSSSRGIVGMLLIGDILVFENTSFTLLDISLLVFKYTVAAYAFFDASVKVTNWIVL